MKSLILLALVCLLGTSFAQQNIGDLANLAIDYTQDVDVAVIKHGNDGVQVTTTGTNADDLLLHLDSVDLTGNEGEWFVEWVNDEGQVWDVVDDGNGYFTVNGPTGSQEYYIQADEWVEGVPQSSISGVVDDLTAAVVTYVQEAGGEADLTLTEAYAAAVGPVTNALNAAKVPTDTTTVVINTGGR